MSASRRNLIVAAVVAVFLVVGAYLVFRNLGGDGNPVTLSVTIDGSTMTPAQLAAHQNDSVTLTVTADKAEEIHLHGYDIQFHPAPGKPDTKTFKADKTGKFDIEIESTSILLGELDVT